MKEEHWYKMFFTALFLHAVIIALISIPLGKAVRRFDLPSYSVNLVTDVGDGPLGAGPKSAAGSDRAPPKKQAPPSPPKAKPEIKQPVKATPAPKTPVKERSIATKTEKTLKPTKTADAQEPENASKDEVKTLSDRIKQMRSRTSPDVAGVGKEGSTSKGPGSGGTGFGSGGVGTGGGSLEEKYRTDVWEKIKEVWSVPPVLSLRKDLHTRLTIKVRKDGHIADWTIDQRSSSRMYDESIVRALRAVDRVPPIPDGLGLDVIELLYDANPPSAR
jgi:TonB family protein